jgi:hypothetical protein
MPGEVDYFAGDFALEKEVPERSNVDLHAPVRRGIGAEKEHPKSVSSGGCGWMRGQVFLR